jgi:hypothetical protein
MNLLKFNNDKEARIYIKEFIDKRITNSSNEILDLVISMIMFKSSIDNNYYINLEKIEKFL